MLYALQHTRNHGGRVGIMYDSWAMRVLLDFFLARGNDGKGTDKGWRSCAEQTLCVEIFHRPEELHGRKAVQRSQKGR